MSSFERLSLPLVKEAGFGLNVEGSSDMLSLGLGLNSVLMSSTRIIPTRPYRVLGFFPEFVADFESDKYFTDRAPTTFANAITHTRASTATYVDSTGTLQTAAINEPRVGHHVWNGTAWVNEGLLHESEARTNLLTYSEDLSNAAWTKNTGITIGTPVTRKGISLDLIENDGINNFRNVTRSIGSVGNGSYATFCCFIEAGTSDETAIRIDDVVSGASSNRVTVPITWTAGVPSLQADVTLGLTFVDASLQDYGDGLYRVHLTVLNNTGGALTFYPKYFVQWDNTAAAVNTYAGGFQAEIGPTPSSYIPTNSGSTVTRSADVLIIPAANLPWPSPEYIGPELVTNGTFDTDISGWTVPAHQTAVATASGMQVTMDTGAAGGPWTGITTVAGKVYELTFDLTEETGANAQMYVRNGSAFGTTLINNSNLTAGNSYTLRFVAIGTGTFLYLFGGVSAAGSTMTWDNISVREINPLAVSIQMDGRVTYANTWVSGTKAEFIPFRWLADSNNSITHVGDSIDAGDTRLTVQQRSSGVSSFSTILDFLSPEILVPINTASRHGSNFLRSAADGVLGASPTPTSLPDLSAANLNLGYVYNGTIRTFRIWAQDIGDAGLVEATEPSLVPSLS
jgi:hypothetical protein